MLGNVNNELNAAAKRNAIAAMFGELVTIADAMRDMLALPTWYAAEEREYDKMKDRRQAVVARLKFAGMFR